VVLVFELENVGYAAGGGEERAEVITERLPVVLTPQLARFGDHMREEECYLYRLAPRVRGRDEASAMWVSSSAQSTNIFSPAR